MENEYKLPDGTLITFDIGPCDLTEKEIDEVKEVVLSDVSFILEDIKRRNLLRGD